MTNKTRYIPLLLLLLALFSCTSREEREFSALIEHADSIADRNPDSALAILSPLLSSPKGESLAVPTAKLLRVKIDDKLYRPITGYESLVTDTLLPYFRHHDSEWLATALFYAGRICADKGDAPQAIDYYQQTLDAMPEQSNDPDFCGLIYSQIGTLFYYQNLYEEAIVQYKLAYTCQQQGNNTNGMIFDLRDIGNSFLLLESPDSALEYFKRAASLADSTNNRNMYIDVMGEMANLYLDQGNYIEAKKHIQPGIAYLDSANISSTYFIISNIFYQTGQLDSAEYYFKKLLQYGNLYGKQSAFLHLSEMAYQKMQYKEFRELTDSLRLYDDSIKYLNNAEIISRMHSLYNYQLRERQAVREKEEKEKAQSLVIILIAITSILIIAVVALWQYIQKRKLQHNRKMEVLEAARQRSQIEMERKQVLISTLKQQIASIQGEIQQLDKRKDEEYQEKVILLNNENDKLIQQIKELNSELGITRLLRQKNEEEVNALKRTEIFQRFLYVANSSDDMLHEQDWKDFFSAVDSRCRAFKNNLQSLARISETEYKICLLLKSDMSGTKIADLVSMSRSGVTHACQRLYKKLNGEAGSVEDLRLLLKDL